MVRALETRHNTRVTNHPSFFALDRSNLTAWRAIRPADGSARPALLLDTVAGREGQDVHDPYYGPDAGFEEIWNDVRTAAQAIVAGIRAGSFRG